MSFGVPRPDICRLWPIHDQTYRLVLFPLFTPFSLAIPQLQRLTHRFFFVDLPLSDNYKFLQPFPVPPINIWVLQLERQLGVVRNAKFASFQTQEGGGGSRAVVEHGALIYQKSSVMTPDENRLL
jgi:hypothetical protein